MVNNIVIEGNLIKDPEYQVFKKEDGTEFKKTRFTIAHNKSYKENSTPMFFNIEMYNNSADYAMKVLQKGTGVLIIGSLESNIYTDKTGKNVSYTYIKCRNIRVISRGKSYDKSKGSEQEYSTDFELPSDEELERLFSGD